MPDDFRPIPYDADLGGWRCWLIEYWSRESEAYVFEVYASQEEATERNRTRRAPRPVSLHVTSYPDWDTLIVYVDGEKRIIPTGEPCVPQSQYGGWPDATKPMRVYAKEVADA